MDQDNNGQVGIYQKDKGATMKAYMCHWCKRIYLHKRPFMYECHSNAFFKEYDTTEEEIAGLKERGAIIIEGTRVSE